MSYDAKESVDLAYRLLPREQRHELSLPDARIHWSFRPAKSQPRGTVVLLHGVASNGSRWEEFIDQTPLNEHWDVIRLDLRGHAASVCSRRAGIEDWCADLAAVLDAANVSRAVVIGHSLGAQVAMNFAARYPARTRALALLDPLVSEALTEKAVKMRSRLPLLRVAEKVTRTMNHLGFVRKIVPQDLRAMDEEARDKIAQGGKALEDFIRQYSSASNDLQYIHLGVYLRDLQEVGRDSPDPACIVAPTLVIGASSGTYTDSRLMKKWVERLSKARMAVVHCAHWPMTECPQEVSGEILNWLQTDVL